MINKEDFTVDTSRFNTDVMKQVTNISQPNGVRWIPIIDAGIYTLGVSGIEGVKEDVYVQSATYKTNLVGCVWPGNAYFVDFNKPQAQPFWEQGLRNISLPPFNAPVPSGIWLDMNEYSNFAFGEIPPWTTCPSSDEFMKLMKEKRLGLKISPNKTEPSIIKQ